MIVYHFTSAEHGISNIANKRIKVAELDKLNDPFELMAVDGKNKSHRQAFKDMKKELAETKGITCFSKSWGNPVQWAHYGDRFRGVALGFEIPDEIAIPVEYVKERILLELDKENRPRIDEKIIKKILATKYIHWSYEKEIRAFTAFTEEEKRHRKIGVPIFQYFSDQLQLQKVIIGAEASKETEAKIQIALGAFGGSVELIKSRLAFQSYNVVENKEFQQKV